MDVCALSGLPYMYGLGIRIAFYIQWAGVILVRRFDESRMEEIRGLGQVLSGSEALAIILQHTRGNLTPIDFYLSLMLAMGQFIFFVPIYLLRFITKFHPRWNPLRPSDELHSLASRLITMTLLCAVSALGIQFFTITLNGPQPNCEQYGFILGRVRLLNKVWVAFNAMLYIFAIIVAAGHCIVEVFSIRIWRKARRRRLSQHRAYHLRLFRLIADIAVFASLVACVELTRRWNRIPLVSDCTTAAQLIPMLASIGVIVRFLVQFWRAKDDKKRKRQEDEKGRESRIHESPARGNGLTNNEDAISSPTMSESVSPPPNTFQPRHHQYNSSDSPDSNRLRNRDKEAWREWEERRRRSRRRPGGRAATVT